MCAYCLKYRVKTEIIKFCSFTNFYARDAWLPTSAGHMDIWAYQLGQEHLTFEASSKQ